MRPRHLPRLWLMTDERMGDGLWDALTRLPRGGGIVFRHYAVPTGERRRLFAKVRRIARGRGLLLIRAGHRPLRGEQGVHNQGGRGLVTFAIHDARDIVAAQRAGAALVFVSPVFATRSHPGGRGLAMVRLARLVRSAGVPAVALGGMDAARWRRVRGTGAYGWAGVDAWFGPDLAKPRRQTSPREAGRAFLQWPD